MKEPEYKLIRKDGRWKAIVAVGSTTITIIASNFNFIVELLSKVF